MSASLLQHRVVAIALGETDRAAETFVQARFPSSRVTWLDRRQVRRDPIGGLRRLRAADAHDALLFVPDLGAPRVKLTAPLLAALPARRRWLADRSGRCETFALAAYLRRSGVVVLRHLVAVLTALLLARPLLMLAELWLALEAKLRLRHVRARRPRRLLYLRSQFWFGLQGGGSVAHTSGVVGGLQRAGTEVVVVTSDPLRGVDAPQRVVAPERWFDGRLRDAEELAYNGAFWAAALQVARQVRPDAIYQRYTAFNFGGALLSRLLRLPFVLEFNSSDVWKGRHWGELHLLGLAERAERVNLRAADTVVVVSRVLRDDLVAAGVAAHKVLVNPNAVDTEHFRPDLPALDIRDRYGLDGTVVVGFSGTFGVWHGIPTLVEMLPIVADARPDVRFLLVGDGALRPLVEEAVARHRLQERVVLPGLVPHEEMPRYLAACDVLLSPHGRQTDGREFFGSPTKLYEYMAAGRAIVASRLGQIGDVLRHEDSALLVEPEDARGLADAVVRLVDDVGLRARLAAAARQQAVREHTWQRNAERVLQALEGVRT